MSSSEATVLDFSKFSRPALPLGSPAQSTGATTLFYAKSEEQDGEDYSWHPTDDGEKLGYFRTKEELRAKISKVAKIQFDSGDSITVPGHEVTRWKICTLETLSPAKYLRR